MPLDIPNLDDRRWTDLVEEARSLIPRVAPRWTDHNVHDPGITFIELFAWLAEMQIYQLNRVGERHREAFARLAGVTRRPRTPARVDIVVRGNANAGIAIPEGTQVVPLEGDELVFETTSRTALTRSRLQRIVVDDGSGPVDQTNANESAGIAFLAFGERAGAGSELRLGFDAFYPGQEQTLTLKLDVFTADLDQRCGADAPIPADGASDAEALPPVALAWEYWAADGGWRPLDPRQDETAGLSRSGAVVVPMPQDAAVGQGRVWIRCRIVRGQFDIEPRLRQVAVNVLSCVQRETVQSEMVGRGNGRPDQWFELARGPVLVPESGPAVHIEVAGEAWEYTSSFDDSIPASKQFTFDVQSRRVVFGNGLNGRVPMPGEDVRAWYRTSAGRSGNVAKGLTWKFGTFIVAGVSLTNPSEASSGADPESLDQMELRARALLNRPNRAVTLNDIERLALGTPGVHVARAHALVNCPSPERITVVAVPKVRPGRTGPPAPASDAFLRTVRRHLDERRLLCDNVRVVRPVYVEVQVSARLRLSKGAGPAAVVERARQALDRFFRGETTASGGDASGGANAAASPCPTCWPIGRSVFPSDLYAVLDRVAGVDSVPDLALRGQRDGASIAPDVTGSVRVPATGLVFPGRHDLTVEPDSGRRR